MLFGGIRITSSMGPADYRNRPTRTKQVAQCICEMCRVGESADEEDIDFFRQFFEEAPPAGVANKRNLMPRLLAPCADNLGHDTGEIRAHDAAPKCLRRRLRDQIDYSDT